MPLGRSVVTLQGPSFSRRSASARSRRTESTVHASLRIIALWIGSASSSETSVMGRSAAREQATARIQMRAFFTLLYFNGRPLLLSAPLVGRVEFAADQSDDRHQVHPHQQ